MADLVVKHSKHIILPFSIWYNPTFHGPILLSALCAEAEQSVPSRTLCTTFLYWYRVQKDPG